MNSLTDPINKILKKEDKVKRYTVLTLNSLTDVSNSILRKINKEDVSLYLSQIYKDNRNFIKSPDKKDELINRQNYYLLDLFQIILKKIKNIVSADNLTPIEKVSYISGQVDLFIKANRRGI